MERLEKLLKIMYDEQKIKTENDFLRFFAKVSFELSATLKEKELVRLVELRSKGRIKNDIHK